jgi:peptidoglycan/LPS O-acetylase OafA/YrhL
MNNDAMVSPGVVASLLPESITPYLALMIGGFLVAIWGQMARSPKLVALGIAMIFLGTLLIPLALQFFADEPPPPGPKVPLAFIR